MKIKNIALSLVTASLAMPTVAFGVDCPKGFDAVQIDTTIIASSNLQGCPLLENIELKKLVDKYSFGTFFAYPTVPGSCLSGNVTGGSMIFPDGSIANITNGFSESAQRFFPEAAAMDATPLFMTGLTSTGKPFASGAAMTVVTLSGDHNGAGFEYQLLMDDRFTLDLSNNPQFSIDVEEFTILGAKNNSAVGRLTGLAIIPGTPQQPINNAHFQVQGSFCLK